MNLAWLSLAAAASLDPFDCYQGNGEKYPGLMKMTKSGRSCQNWLKTEPHQTTVSSADAGIGNHNYCRNPNGREQPWCYTLDPDMEWEYCTVPQCTPETETPEAWVAPDGLKSDEAAAEGPCEPDPDTTPKYEAFDIIEYGKTLEPGACKGEPAPGKDFLIGKTRTDQADYEACTQHCLETAGAKFATFWDSAMDDGNCGCYRECVPTGAPEEGAVNSPTTYRFNFAFLQKRTKKCKGTAEVRPAKPHRDEKKVKQLSDQLGSMLQKLGWSK